ncbi:MAG TPA: c-type cytochrome [Steroidobacteraceae bacterium]|jgi:cbb3-type cytochrome c oxidase subunit III|nr:c-type cytochrome [Steroidobacteraceae bacterium]
MTASIRLVCCVLTLWVAPISWSHGSVEGGAALSGTCLACHGANGNSSNPEWPNLAGQNAAYVEHQLHLFHDGRRTGKMGDASASMMPAMATPLTNQNIEDVAAYYSQQTPAGLEADPSYWEAGQKIYRYGDRARGIPACAACHGPSGRGNPAAGYPALRAQHSVYVVKQLSAYSTEVRYAKNEHGASYGGDNAAIMHTIAARLSDEDMRNVASYIQGMR